jgi:hypothetical protein
MRRLAHLALVAALTGAACPPADPDNGVAPNGDGFASIHTLDARTVIIIFTRKVKGETVRPDHFRVWDRTVVPAAELAVNEVAASGAAEVTVVTGEQEHGRVYTMTIQGLEDHRGFSLDGALNFLGGGPVSRAPVRVRVEDADRARAWGPLRVVASVDPGSGTFTDRMSAYPLVAAGTAQEAVLSVEVNPRRTLDRRDDGDPSVDRRAYALRVVSVETGEAASPLVAFEVTDPGGTALVVPLLDPPTGPVGPTGPSFDPPVDPNPGDGRKRVRVIVDDRQSRELLEPAVKASFTAGGDFDVSFPQTLALGTPQEPRFYEVEVDVKVDPNRRMDGLDEDTLPYIVYLFSNGRDYDGINLSIIAPDETPETVQLKLGADRMTPITFRVDTRCALLVPDGSQRGVFPDEAVWLTGEWQTASDAFGQNAGDAFTGGEQRTLEMRPDPDHPGVWTKTIWLPPGRPYGWKVLRCQRGVGCGPLNRRVASSGRAFATVMKNVATENLDAFSTPRVVIVDPCNAGAVVLPSGPADYSRAGVYVGNGAGAENNPPWAPRPDTLFKQEVPDLAVSVSDQPIITPVYVVGTWRDVNLPVRPAEIVSGTATVDMTPHDYDEGMIGRYPPTRSLP